MLVEVIDDVGSISTHLHLIGIVAVRACEGPHFGSTILVVRYRPEGPVPRPPVSLTFFVEVDLDLQDFGVASTKVDLLKPNVVVFVDIVVVGSTQVVAGTTDQEVIVGA